MSFLLDTNVLLELRKRRPDPAVLDWFDAVDASDVFVSALVVGEIRQGIERLRRRDPAQAAAVEDWLAQLRAEFADRVVPVTVEIAELWGRLNATDPVPVVDGLLAATALVHGWTLVTRNTADVVGTGVRLIDPFRR